VSLELDHLTKNFSGLKAVHEVSFTVDPGEILGLIGPNGAGKTTIFNLVTGFITPSNGDIRFEGENISRIKPHELAKKGIVRTFQITNLFPNLTVYKNVLIGRHLIYNLGFWASLFGFRKRKHKMELDDKKIIELLRLVKLEAIKDEIVQNVPGGYQNLIQIITALAAEPKILLLDEPTGGLNPEEIHQVANLISQIRDLGIAILLVEHNMQVIMGICDRIVVLNHGQKIAEGTPPEIKSNEDVIEAYLGSEEIA
jgi:branched-chain amino acid transport system ATP-binding protein